MRDRRGPPRIVDQPRAGFFTLRMVKGGPRLPARIHVDFGQYWAEVDGRKYGDASDQPHKADGVLRIWHYGEEIDRAEYDRLMRRTERPDPMQPINLATRKSLF